jgi:hypothetical protein
MRWSRLPIFRWENVIERQLSSLTAREADSEASSGSKRRADPVYPRPNPIGKTTPEVFGVVYTLYEPEEKTKRTENRKQYDDYLHDSPGKENP